MINPKIYLLILSSITYYKYSYKRVLSDLRRPILRTVNMSLSTNPLPEQKACDSGLSSPDQL